MDLEEQVAATVDKPKDGVRRRKTRFNWKLPNDIALAKSVLQNTPFKQPRNRKTAAWMKVATEINELFKTNLDAVAVSRHYDIIVYIHRKEETKNRYASGKEEEVAELDTLLSELVNMEEDHKLSAEEECEAKKKKVDEQKLKAEEVRAAAVTTIKSPEGGAPQKRSMEKSLISLYLQKQESEKEIEKQKAAIELQKLEQEKEENRKNRELKLQELQLQRDQFEHRKRQEEEELQLRKRQAEAQEEERKCQLKTQETLLQLLLKKL